MATSIIGSVDPSKVWETRLRDNYVVLTEKIAPKKVPDLASALEEHFAAERAKGVELVQCDVCFGWSPEELPEGVEAGKCPYCGQGEEIDAPKPEDSKPSAPSTRRKKVAEPVPVENVSHGKLSAPVVPVEDVSHGKLLAPSTAPLALLATGSATNGSDAELDRELDAFRHAQRAAGNDLFEMGKSLRKIRDHYWSVRRGDDGKQKYKNWEACVEEELGITRSWAKKLANATDAMLRAIDGGTEPEALAEVAVTTLAAIGMAPLAEQAALVRKAVAGATREQIVIEVQQIKDGAHQRDAADARAAGMPEPKKTGRPRKPRADLPKTQDEQRAAREQCNREALRSSKNPSAAIAVVDGRAGYSFDTTKKNFAIASGTRIVDRALIEWWLFKDANGRRIVFETTPGTGVTSGKRRRVVFDADPETYGGGRKPKTTPSAKKKAAKKTVAQATP